MTQAMTNRQQVNKSLLAQHHAKVAVALARCKCLGGTTPWEAVVRDWCCILSPPLPSHAKPGQPVKTL